MKSLAIQRALLFRDLSDQALHMLQGMCLMRHYKRGRSILFQGDQSQALYTILCGSVSLSASDVQGRELTLGRLGAGESFGFLTLLGASARATSVCTLENSQIAVLSKAKFSQLVLQHPQLTTTIFKLMAERIIDMTEDITCFGLMSVEGRVCRLLKRLAQTQGDETVLHRISHQNIANHVGSSREMVSKIIGQLRQQGYIRVDSRHISILHTLPHAYARAPAIGASQQRMDMRRVSAER